MKRLLPLPFLLLLMGPDCTGPTPPPPPEPKGFCTGMETGVVDSAVRNVKGFWNAIIGGFPAEDRHSTVYIHIIGKGSCSGTILNSHTVLTAGHCNGTQGYGIYLDPVADPYPGCFTGDDGTPRTCWNASGSLLHPGYYRWSSNRGEPHDDLLLLYVTEELPGPYPAGIFDDDTMSARCVRSFGQGWGQTARSDAPPPEEFEPIPCPDGQIKCLQEADLRVFEERGTDINSRLVSAINWGNICFGDSGGAMYAELQGYSEPFVAGITSTVSAANCVGYTAQAYGTHVKASAYKGWIEANMR